MPSEVRSQLTNALAVWAGVVTGDDARELVRRITDPASLLPVTPGDYRQAPDFTPPTGGIVPIGTPALGTVLAKVMFGLGMGQDALDYFREMWPPIVINGTLGEHFVPSDNSSMCHAWSAAPTLLLPRCVLGVKPLTPGWTEVEVAPQPSGLDWAEGTVLTPLGELGVSWKMDGERDLGSTCSRRRGCRSLRETQRNHCHCAPSLSDRRECHRGPVFS